MLQDLLFEMFGLKLYVMRFCWYVSFYIILMLVFPFYAKIIKKQNGIKWSIGISITFCAIIQLLAKITEKIDTFKVMQGISIYFPVAIMGYLFLKYDILNRINNKVLCGRTFKIIIGITFICISLALHGVKSYVKGISIGVVVVPLLMEGIALIQIDTLNYIGKIVQIFGKNSMNIWFLHCIFFSLATRKIFQPIAYIFKNPVFVVGWILVLCAIVSVPIGKLQQELIRRLLTSDKTCN